MVKISIKTETRLQSGRNVIIRGGIPRNRYYKTKKNKKNVYIYIYIYIFRWNFLGWKVHIVASYLLLMNSFYQLDPITETLMEEEYGPQKEPWWRKNTFRESILVSPRTFQPTFVYYEDYGIIAFRYFLSLFLILGFWLMIKNINHR